MSKPLYKVEIINNFIGNVYEIVLYEWKRKYWWNKKSWNWIYRHTLGKRYVYPEIHQGKITVEDYFKREVDLLFKRYEISEVHRIEIKTT